MNIRLLGLMLILVAMVLSCNERATLPGQSTARDNQTTVQEANKLLTANQPSDDQVNTSYEQAAVGDTSLNVNDSLLSVLSITMLWGQIPPDPLDTTPVYDWSGSASVNGVGRYVVVCPIDFEKGYDSLLPVTNQTTIAWHSTTDGDIDGLATLLVLRNDVQYFAEPHFVFTSGLVSLDIPVSHLDNFDTVIAVNGKQSLAIKAWHIHRPVCPTGTLTGEWIRFSNNGDSGTFQGTWNGPDGKPIGPLA